MCVCARGPGHRVGGPSLEFEAYYAQLGPNVIDGPQGEASPGTVMLIANEYVQGSGPTGHGDSRGETRPHVLYKRATKPRL